MCVLIDSISVAVGALEGRCKLCLSDRTWDIWTHDSVLQAKAQLDAITTKSIRAYLDHFFMDTKVTGFTAVLDSFVAPPGFLG